MSDAGTTVNPPDLRPRPDVHGLRLNPRIDPAPLGPVFARFGRIHVPGILDRDSALAVHGALADPGIPWQMHYNDGPSAYDVPAAQVDRLPAAELDALLRPIHARARTGFQYLFDNFSMSDHRARGEFLDLALMRVLDFLQSPAMLEFARRVTGIREIVTVDAQATRYRPGHFLTVHDDRDEKKGRVAAYVLNMTPGWRVDWGGILHFLDSDGHVAEGYVPAFNAINLFRVPSPHSVGLVAPFAGGVRLSITGWFRSH